MKLEELLDVYSVNNEYGKWLVMKAFPDGMIRTFASSNMEANEIVKLCPMLEEVKSFHIDEVNNYLVIMI